MLLSRNFRTSLEIDVAGCVCVKNIFNLVKVYIFVVAKIFKGAHFFSGHSVLLNLNV